MCEPFWMLTWCYLLEFLWSLGCGAGEARHAARRQAGATLMCCA